MNNNILVIDDEPDILKALEITLGQEAYHVTTASGGEEGMEIFRRKPFDLVMTDMRMPRMDGLQVILNVKALAPDVEVIVLTGYATLDNAISALRDMGAFDYLTKPLENMDELFVAVAKALEKRRMTLENRALVKNLKEKERELARQNRALHRSELLKQAVLDGISSMLCFVNRDLEIVWGNRALLQAIDLSPKGLAGRKLSAVMGGGAGKFPEYPMTRAISSGEPQQVILKSPSGKIVDARATPVTDEKGRLLGVLGVADDITDRELRQEEMARMAKLESLGTLSGGIAHDFNNLFSVILGNIELAMLEIGPEKPSSKALENAKRGCFAARELTGQFITFSRGGYPRKRVTAMEPFLRKTVSLSLSGSNVDCEYGIPEGLDLVELDKRQMGQVFHNLIQNALEAMPGGGTIRIRVENASMTGARAASVAGLPEGRYVKVVIQDEGCGIPEEHKFRVFDPYFSTKSRGEQKGMGLGLSTGLSIVKKHGGVILLESNGASGTAASVYLPAVPETKAAKGGITAAVLPADGLLKGRKVLVMDDEKMVREMIIRMLKSLGHDAVGVRDGNEAVAAYLKGLEGSSSFDLVILDLTVRGGAGGKEVIGELLKLDPDVRAVVCSGYGDDPVMSDYETYGFRASLVKPFLKASLEAAMETALGLGGDRG